MDVIKGAQILSDRIGTQQFSHEIRTKGKCSVCGKSRLRTRCQQGAKIVHLCNDCLATS